MVQGSNTLQKVELVAKGPKSVFRIRAYVGATSAWGSSCIASISFHSHIDDNKVLKICGAQGPVCLPHAVLVSGLNCAPLSEDYGHLCSSQSLDVRTLIRLIIGL
jgi:hypothetical protein